MIGKTFNQILEKTYEQLKNREGQMTEHRASNLLHEIKFVDNLSGHKEMYCRNLQQFAQLYWEHLRSLSNDKIICNINLKNIPNSESEKIIEEARTNFAINQAIQNCIESYIVENF